MTRVNVIIAKRGRDVYLEKCLQSLELAALEVDFDVDVYVIDDRRLEYTSPIQSTIHVHNFYLCLNHAPFNKSKLLNCGLSLMRRPFDWVSIVDVDMIYSREFFKQVSASMVSGACVVSHGVGLSKEDTAKYFRSSDDSFLSSTNSPYFPGASQISLHKRAYKTLTDIYGEKLYCEDFVNWGGEDSDLSFKLKDLNRVGIVKLRNLNDMWIHMYHDRDLINKEINISLFKERRLINKETLNRWISVNGERVDSTNTNMQV